MTVEYDNNLRGVLFKNDKNGNDKRPDYRGSALIDGVEFSMSGWIKASKKTGDKFLSLKFELKPQGQEPRQGGQAQRPQPAQRPPARQADPVIDDFDDDIPF